MQVQGQGNDAIIEALTEAGALLKREQYPHKYPYDWRTKKPTIFRATDQVSSHFGLTEHFLSPRTERAPEGCTLGGILSFVLRSLCLLND